MTTIRDVAGAAIRRMLGLDAIDRQAEQLLREQHEEELAQADRDVALFDRNPDPRDYLPGGRYAGRRRPLRIRRDPARDPYEALFRGRW